jgi:GTP-dependent phosphoenolpyruvate carboxykinase
MKRKEYSTHSLESCIEYIQKANSAKVFLLENENKELKKKINLNAIESKQEITRVNNLLAVISNHISWSRPKSAFHRFS